MAELQLKECPVKQVRILSVRQPYADEIIYGDKWNELRSRATPYRGHIYIHASRWDVPRSEGSPGPGRTGAIIGRVTLVDCIPGEDLENVRQYCLNRRPIDNWLELLGTYLKPLPDESWDHGIGDWNWLLLDPLPLQQPIPSAGKLNLWNAEMPAEQLVCGPPVTSVARPDPFGYPALTAPDVIYREVTVPFGTVSGGVFRLLRPKKVNGLSFDAERLKSVAAKFKTTTSNIQKTLEANPEFERVPESPARENRWRIRQSPIEVRRQSDWPRRTSTTAHKTDE